MVLVTIASSPTVELTTCPAGEFQKLVPVFLEEIENTGYAGVLIGYGISKRTTVNVYVKSAGIRLMRQISHAP